LRLAVIIIIINYSKETMNIEELEDWVGTRGFPELEMGMKLFINRYE
jgi:hypothetical protein